MWISNSYVHILAHSFTYISCNSTTNADLSLHSSYLVCLPEVPILCQLLCLSDGLLSHRRIWCPLHGAANDLGEVCVHEQLLSLRFAFHIGTIYVEKEIFDDSGLICETILQRKSRTAEGDIWNLTRGMYRIFGLTDAQLSASTVLVTPRNSTSSVQVPTQPTVKIESSDVNVHVISDSDDDAISDGPTGGTSRIPIRHRGSIGSTRSFPTPDLRRSPSINSSRPSVHPDSQRP